MIWNDFRTEVRKLLPAYTNMHGAQNLIDTNTVVAVSELMAAVPEIRVRTSTVPATATTDNFTGKITIPARSILVGLLARSTTDASVIREYDHLPLKDLEYLRQGRVSNDTRLYAYDPSTGVIWVSPVPSVEEAQLEVTYDSTLPNFAGTDETRLTLLEAPAVAEFIMARLALYVDHDTQAAQIHTSIYQSMRRNFMSRANEARLQADVVSPSIRSGLSS